MERNNLEKVFNKIKKERGEVASIYKAFSDFPEGVQAHFQFYKKILLDPDLPLSRLQREYLAFSTSQENQCPYCIGHHREAFQRQGGDLPQQEKDLFKEFSKTLTHAPWKASLFKKRFLDLGLGLDQWKHAVFVVSYFNMANRLALSMNLDLEEKFEQTCN